MSMFERKVHAPALPAYLTEVIAKELKRLGFDLANPAKLAECVRILSDYYIEKPSYSTPWSEKSTQVAYLCYFLPLNYIRSRTTLKRIDDVGFLQNISSLSDFGAGPGTAALAVLDHLANKPSVSCIESSSVAHDLGKKIFSAQAFATPQYVSSVVKTDADLLVASYSLTELDSIPKFFFKHENILLIEPSTKSDSRRLITFRSELLSAGYHVWAPCCHQNTCPLESSERDWCHDRTEWQMPDWFQAIEALLPIKNRTLSFSYLAVSRRAPNVAPNLIRVTGDQQIFKGFTKQLICRSSEREFISWQKRDFKDPPKILRGDLCTIDGPTKNIANEIRPASETEVRIFS